MDIMIPAATPDKSIDKNVFVSSFRFVLPITKPIRKLGIVCRKKGGKTDGGKAAELPEGGKNPPTFASKTSFILQRNFPVFFEKIRI